MIIEATLAATFVAALVVLIAPDRWAPKLGLAGSALPLLGSLWMYLRFDGSGNALLDGSLAFETNAAWLSAAGYELRWFVGLDGISLPLVVLTGVHAAGDTRGVDADRRATVAVLRARPVHRGRAAWRVRRA
jgi:NADH-quinone oxidoreductase subunit M